MNKFLFSLSAILLVIAGCVPRGTAEPPVINSFEASRVSITSGEPSTLSWSVSNATTVSIDQGIGVVGLTGTKVVSPTADTTHTLTATNGAGTSTATSRIVVTQKPAALPVINSFAADPESICAGNSSTLSWNVSDAAEITIEPDVGSVELIGNVSVLPEASTTYTLTAANESGSATAKAEVTVTGPSPHSVTLSSIGAEDGHVIQGEAIHPHPYAGDTDKNRGRQAFLSFDISGIPAGATIQSASLDLSGGDELGEPFVGLGAMNVYDHQYGTLDGSEFVSDFPGGEMRKCYSRPTGASRSSKLASEIQARVDAGASRFQIRLQFQKHTDGDYRDDMLRLREPKLVITYVKQGETKVLINR